MLSEERVCVLCGEVTLPRVPLPEGRGGSRVTRRRVGCPPRHMPATSLQPAHMHHVHPAPKCTSQVHRSHICNKRISAKCAIICTFLTEKSHVQKYAPCALVSYMHGAPVLYTKVCTSYMHKSICKSMHTCATLTNTETSRTSVGERAEISTKESTLNITISFVQSISHQKIQTFFNSQPLVLSASLPWGAGTSIVLFTLLRKWGQLYNTLHF